MIKGAAIPTTRASHRLPRRFVVCVSNNGCDDLSLHTMYELLPDTDADKVQHFRVIDDSGEDYLYPTLYFLLVELSEPLQDVFTKVAQFEIEHTLAA